jgi:putative acetyltransferase
MNIRSRTPSDDHAIAELNRLAFKRGNEAKLVESIRQTDRYIPELELVAELDCGVVGHILFSYIDLVGQENLLVIGLAPVAVRPEFQRQGFGSALLRVGLETALGSPFPVPEEFFMVKPLKNYQERYRGKIVYPPAFNGV